MKIYQRLVACRLLITLLLRPARPVFARNETPPRFRDPDLPLERRAEDLAPINGFGKTGRVFRIKVHGLREGRKRVVRSGWGLPHTALPLPLTAPGSQIGMTNQGAGVSVPG